MIRRILFVAIALALASVAISAQSAAPIYDVAIEVNSRMPIVNHPQSTDGYAKVDVALFGLNCRDETVDLFDSLGSRVARLKTPSDLFVE